MRVNIRFPKFSDVAITAIQKEKSKWNLYWPQPQDLGTIQQLHLCSCTKDRLLERWCHLYFPQYHLKEKNSVSTLEFLLRGQVKNATSSPFPSFQYFSHTQKMHPIFPIHTWIIYNQPPTVTCFTAEALDWRSCSP